MSTDAVDVAIVGASLAGCTAATLFARRGLRVALLERQADPEASKRICTHFIQPSATSTIDRLGLAPAIEAAGGVRNALDVWSRFGWIRVVPESPDFPLPYGYSIQRAKLDPLVRGLAAAEPNVALVLGATACGLRFEAGECRGVEIETRDGRRRVLDARLVVGADGRRSKVAELARVPARVRPNARVMYYAYYRDLPLSSGTRGQLWFLEPDVAYAYPNDDGLTLVAWAFGRERVAAFKRDPEATFVRRFAELPLAPNLRAATRVAPLLGQLDLGNLSRPAAARGLAFVGDAAMASDPLWAVGCGWAFQSAEWLVESTADALVTGRDLGRALACYRRRHRAELAGHHLMIASYATGRALLPHERLFLSAAASDPVTARRLAAFGERLIRPTAFVTPRNVGRALGVVVAERLRRIGSRSSLASHPKVREALEG
jgi:2-polyprenyl-6-methoxyphenol hydroxylase-like FAD-dependent oxidoreductase